MDKASPMSDISDLSDKMDSVRSDWAQVRDKLSKRTGQLKKASTHAEKFTGELETMKMWLMFNEEKLSTLGPLSLDKDKITKQLKDAQVCVMCSNYVV